MDGVHRRQLDFVLPALCGHALLGVQMIQALLCLPATWVHSFPLQVTQCVFHLPCLQTFAVPALHFRQPSFALHPPSFFFPCGHLRCSWHSGHMREFFRCRQGLPGISSNQTNWLFLVVSLLLTRLSRLNFPTFLLFPQTSYGPQTTAHGYTDLLCRSWHLL